MKTAFRSLNLFQRLQEAFLALSDFEQVIRSQTTLKTRDEIERIVMLATSADLMGLSLAPPSLTLRLLPYFTPKVYQWKRLTQGGLDFSAAIKTGC